MIESRGFQNFTSLYHYLKNYFGVAKEEYADRAGLVITEEFRDETLIILCHCFEKLPVNREEIIYVMQHALLLFNKLFNQYQLQNMSDVAKFQPDLICCLRLAIKFDFDGRSFTCKKDEPAATAKSDKYFDLESDAQKRLDDIVSIHDEELEKLQDYFYKMNTHAKNHFTTIETERYEALKLFTKDRSNPDTSVDRKLFELFIKHHIEFIEIADYLFKIGSSDPMQLQSFSEQFYKIFQKIAENFTNDALKQFYNEFIQFILGLEIKTLQNFDSILEILQEYQILHESNLTSLLNNIKHLPEILENLKMAIPLIAASGLVTAELNQQIQTYFDKVVTMFADPKPSDLLSTENFEGMGLGSKRRRGAVDEEPKTRKRSSRSEFFRVDTKQETDIPPADTTLATNP